LSGSPNVHIRIEYSAQSGEQPTYTAVTIAGPGDAIERFATSDPVADFQAATEAGRAKAAVASCTFMTTSSLDHFVFDVPGWRFTWDGMLERDPRDYHSDGRVKTKAAIEEEDARGA
jgi:hypothetical protein